MIDHLSFPHIVDAVFESAPFESLDIMSAVCRGWRSRALAQIGHLYIDMDSNTYRYPFSIPLAIAARQCRLLDIDTGCPVAYLQSGGQQSRQDRRLSKVQETGCSCSEP